MALHDFHQGRDLPGDTGSPFHEKPKWYNDDKFRAGQKFFQKHCAVITFSMHCSLLAGLSISNLLDPLVFTQQSDTGKKAFKRYLMTFYHIYLWMTEDIWDKESTASKSLRVVRNMHNNVAMRMQKDSAFRKNISISQYDMGLVQSGFFAAILMYQTQFGIHCTDEEMDCYVFCWRVIGYKLGIEDKYNICQDELKDTKKLVRDVERNCLLPALQNPPNNFQRMADAYITGNNSEAPVPVHSTHSLLCLIYDGMGQRYPHKLGFADSLRYYMYKLTFAIIYYFPSMERSLNAWFLRTGPIGKFLDLAKAEMQKQQQRYT